MELNIKILERIIKNLPNYIFVKDTNLQYILCNHNFSVVAGTNPLNKNDYDLSWSKQSSDIYQEEDRYVLSTGKSILDKEVSMALLGEEKILSTSKVPLYDEDHQIIGVVGISVDITYRKKAEQEVILAKEKAEVANQAKTEFLENMRHDIRTPLSGIVGCAHLIQSASTNPAITEYANDLVESSDALLEFLNKILESITVASGEIPLLKKKFDIYHLLDQVVRLNQSQATVKKLLLTLDYDPSIPAYLIGDPVRVQRIVLELITNALKFTKKGQIKVSVRLMKQEARQLVLKLSVSDTGIGIPIEKQSDIYTRFKRLSPSYQGIYPGTGLGLSVVKQFLDDLEGEIYLESSLEKGSTFNCLIPLQEPLLTESESGGIKEITSRFEVKEATSENTPDRIEAPTDETPTILGSRILIVEDNKIAAMVAKAVLLGLNCQVDIAIDGKMALDSVEKQHYDLIFMDVGLPDMSGGEVTRRIRLKQWQRSIFLPIVGLTAHVSPEEKRNCLDLGMNAVYNKPLTPELASKILVAFIPAQQDQTIVKSIDPLKERVLIDIDQATDLLGDSSLVKEILDLFATSLGEGLEVIQQRYEERNWPAIRAIAHKWKGGGSYCGARRLQQTCEQFETAFKTASPETIERLYQQLMQVAKMTKDEVATVAMEAID